MSIGGALAVIQDEHGFRVNPSPATWATLVAGILLMLYSFKADDLASLPVDAQSLSQVRSSGFNWLVYLVGFALTVLLVWRVAKLTQTKTN